MLKQMTDLQKTNQICTTEEIENRPKTKEAFPLKGGERDGLYIKFYWNNWLFMSLAIKRDIYH